MKVFEKGMTLIELTVVLLILIALAGVAIPYVSGTSQMALCRATDATLYAVKEAIMGGGAGPGFYGDTLGYYPAEDKTNDLYNLHYLFSRDMPKRDGDPVSHQWSLYNPKTAVGWRGPYLMTSGFIDQVSDLNPSFAQDYPANPAYTHFDLKSFDGSDADTIATADEAKKIIHVFDAWHRPIILQVPYNTNVGKFNSDYARLVSAGPGVNAGINTKIQYDGTGDALPDASDRDRNRVLYLKKPDPYAQGNISCENY